MLMSGSAAWLRTTQRNRTMVAISLILHGALTELIQTQVPYRDGNRIDVVIDSVSVLIGWLATLRWRPT